MIAMTFGLAVFVFGLVLLVIASCMKIQRLDTVLSVLHRETTGTTGTSFTTTGGHFNGSGDFYTLHDLGNMTEGQWAGQNSTTYSAEPNLDEKSSSCAAIVALSILGFMCLDMGFDLSIAISRASILDVVPKFQHKPVLVLATIVQSVAGFICATIGCFDLPTLLGSLFHTDGSAATLIFFCCVLLTTSFASFSLMGFANYRLSKRKRSSAAPKSDQSEPQRQSRTRKESFVLEAFDQLEERGVISVVCTATRLSHLEDNEVFASSSIAPGSPTAYKRPLLLDSLKTNYLTMSSGASMDSVFEDYAPSSNGFDAKSLEDEKHFKKSQDTLGTSISSNDSRKKLSVSSYNDADEDTLTHLETIKENGCMAIAPLGALNTTGAELTGAREQLPKPDNSGDSQERYRRMKIKLLILWLSSFFSVGSNLTFSLYSFNVLNLEIMGGDPAALPGSEGRHNYEAGLRLGSFANMVFYSAFLLISLTNTRVLQLLGEKCQFVLNHLLLIAGLVAVMLTERIDVFMIYMGCGGLFRPCMLTLPYVMAHQYAQEGMPPEDCESEPGPRKSHTGRVMTLIGLLVPCHYCLLSIMMGPLMEATGDPWVPLFYCLGSCTVSLGVFSFLFFV
ncbi:hypothetical protein EGW08_005741 [Elysia chlorotica]|uniref:Uncharacterized protein n=1 Tax=Elysia chlorotica TaxID=188477 RepID=A0A433TY34_ELYCH|nr:hypothetical protein EGW08_005741 [Elysia chlorotica]